MTNNWKVGDRLEAQDYLNCWYTAKIIGYDAEKDFVLVHFEGWNQRYDEWVHIKSNRLRPLSSESHMVLDPPNLPMYHTSQYVMAMWSDGMMYPGKIRSINRKSEKYDIMFLDGMRKSVMFRHVYPMNRKQKLLYNVPLTSPTRNATHIKSFNEESSTKSECAYKLSQNERVCLYCSDQCASCILKCGRCSSACCQSCNDLLQPILPNITSFNCLYCTASQNEDMTDIGNVQRFSSTGFIECIKELDHMEEMLTNIPGGSHDDDDDRIPTIKNTSAKETLKHEERMATIENILDSMDHKINRLPW